MNRRRPPWVDIEPRNNVLRVEPCPTCRRTVLRALVDGCDIRADPVPLDIHAELAAKLARRWTFDVRRTWVGSTTTRLHLRYPHHMANRDHPIVAAHHCPGPAPPPPDEPEPDRLF